MLLGLAPTTRLVREISAIIFAGASPATAAAITATVPSDAPVAAAAAVGADAADADLSVCEAAAQHDVGGCPLRHLELVRNLLLGTGAVGGGGGGVISSFFVAVER